MFTCLKRRAGGSTTESGSSTANAGGSTLEAGVVVTKYGRSGVKIDPRGSSSLASEAALSASQEVAVAVVTGGGATASSLATIRRALEEIRERDPRTFSIVYSQYVSSVF